MRRFYLGPASSFFLELFLQWYIGYLLTLEAHLSVSCLFAFSYCSWGSQGKNAEVVCHQIPWWLRRWRNRLQCRRPQFDPWVGKKFDPLKKEMTTHSSIFSWRIPWTEEPSGLQSKGSQRVRRNWATEHKNTAQTDLKSKYRNSVRLYFFGLQNHCR